MARVLWKAFEVTEISVVYLRVIVGFKSAQPGLPEIRQLCQHPKNISPRKQLRRIGRIKGSCILSEPQYRVAGCLQVNPNDQY